MSIKNSLSPLRPVKQARTLAVLTTSVAVSGGLVAGLGISQSAGAAPETGVIHDAAAATTPLELKSVTPAKKLVVAPKAAPKPASAKSAATQVSKRQTAATQVSERKTAATQVSKRKTAATQVSKRKTAATQVSKRQAAATHVSRSQARAALTAPAAKVAKPVAKKAAKKPATMKPVTTKQAVRKAPVAHRSATSWQHTPTHLTPKHTTKPAPHHVRTRQAAAKPVQVTTQRHATVQRHAANTQVSRSQARAAVTTRHVAVRPVHTASQPQQRQQARPAQVSRTQVRQAVTARSATPTYASRAQSATTAVSTPAKASTSGVVSIAAGLTGIPYVHAGSSMSGVDCSGFVAMVYAKVGIQLPHQSGAIKAMTRPVSTPQPGDLAFLPGHVAIYAGNGMVYEARHPGTVTGLYPVLPGMTFGRL